MAGLLTVKEFVEVRLKPAALEAGGQGMTLHACVSDRSGQVATVEQTGSEGKGASSVAWMLAVEADRLHSTFFLVLMRRWGDPDGHTYPIGMFHNLVRAQQEGEKEAYYRGGKYTAEIWQVPLGVSAAAIGRESWPFQIVQEAEQSL